MNLSSFKRIASEAEGAETLNELRAGFAADACDTATIALFAKEAFRFGVHALEAERSQPMPEKGEVFILAFWGGAPMSELARETKRPAPEAMPKLKNELYKLYCARLMAGGREMAPEDVEASLAYLTDAKG